MSPNVTSILASPYLLYTTSITSFTVARLIITQVNKHGPITFADTMTKCNNIIYSITSLILCLAITTSFWIDISQTPNPSLQSTICTPSRTELDVTLRYIYHASKLYEYIDIFNVLATSGSVNAHFGIHHFTTPYLTYARVLLHPVGWKVFAFLNTLHHAFMYAYFGGASIFSEVLPVTGGLQLGVGILAELYVVWKGCAGREALWANGLAVALLGTYGVLFAGDLRVRGKRGEDGKERVGEKVE